MLEMILNGTLILFWDKSMHLKPFSQKYVLFTYLKSEIMLLIKLLKALFVKSVKHS